MSATILVVPVDPSAPVDHAFVILIPPGFDVSRSDAASILLRDNANRRVYPSVSDALDQVLGPGWSIRRNYTREGTARYYFLEVETALPSLSPLDLKGTEVKPGDAIIFPEGDQFVWTRCPEPPGGAMVGHRIDTLKDTIFSIRDHVPTAAGAAPRASGCYTLLPAAKIWLFGKAPNVFPPAFLGTAGASRERN